MRDPSSWVFDSAEDYDQAKHLEQRAQNGFSTYDWWNFDQYLAWVIIQACQKFRAEGNGLPADFANVDEWNAVLLEIEDGFLAHAELCASDFPTPGTEEYRAWRDERQEKFRIAIELLGKYYGSLWD